MHASDSAAMPDTVRAPINQSGSKLRIVFMGSPEFAIPSLDRLARTHDVCAVYSQPAKKSGRGMKTTPVPTANYALKAGLPLFTPEHLKSTEIKAQLASHQADLFVVVAYGMLLPAEILAIPRFGCLNGHASLLPRWRGAAPIQRAIEAGDTKTGISAMLMGEELDAGPIVALSHIEISNTDTSGSLHDQLAILAASCLCEVIDAAPKSLKAPVPQSENGVIYAPKITPADAMINWTRSATNLDYHIRAFSPYPGAWCNGPKGRLRILQARPICPTETTPNITPGPMAGRFLCRHADGAMVIGCGDGALAIDQLQPAGKSVMAASDFLNGAGLVIGDFLDSTNQ